MTAVPPPPPTSVLDEEVGLPREIWWFGWSFLAQGVVHLLERGPQDDAASIVLSMALSVLVVTFVSAGVVRARGVRLGIVAVLIGLALAFGLLGLVVDPTLPGVVVVGFAVLQAWLLWQYTRTPWFAWQRTRPAGGPSIAPLLAVAVLVGALGGLTAQQNPEPGFHIDLSSAGASR